MELTHTIEFYRHCYISSYYENNERGKTLYIAHTGSKKPQKPRMFCSCTRGSHPKCAHAAALASEMDRYYQAHGETFPHAIFEESFYYKLFFSCSKTHALSTALIYFSCSENGPIRLCDKQGRLFVEYYSKGEDCSRLFSRFNVKKSPDASLSLYDLRRHARELVLTEVEKEIMKTGHTTTRLAQEESLWLVLAYHCFQEMSDVVGELDYHIDEKDAVFSLTIGSESGDIYVKIVLPPDTVPDVISTLNKHLLPDKHIQLLKEEKRLFFSFGKANAGDGYEFIPVVEFAADNNRTEYVPIQERFFYDYLVYSPERRVFFSFDHESRKLIASRWGSIKFVPYSEISAFLEKQSAALSMDENGSADATITQDLFSTAVAFDFRRLYTMCFIDRFDTAAITIQEINGPRCRVSAEYTAGNETVPLNVLLESREAGRRFAITDRCIVDCKSDKIIPLLINFQGAFQDGCLIIHKALLVYFWQSGLMEIRKPDNDVLRQKLKMLLEFSPSKPLEELENFKTTLRPYQKIAVEWLLCLVDNQIGGLLCDDMGLGKTHEVLGLFYALQQQRGIRGPFLVVCPTTVIGHWAAIIRKYAPLLKINVYHGSHRSTTGDGDDYHILLTSYGILRNECNALRSIHFVVAVFDEAQNLKNVHAQIAKSALAINAMIKICLSGTPLENSLTDVKTLFDLVLPGYLGSDDSFMKKFVQPIESCENKEIRRTFQQLIKPFILRRLKQSVLQELPVKIVDRRLCELPPAQRDLYEKTISRDSRSLLTLLHNPAENIPYLHIFSLLNTLKKICNHPACALNCTERYTEYISGKWELFKEILAECLGSGQKIVVFSQYLSMIALIEQYLIDSRIGYTVLTGATQARAKVIDTFNTNPACVVFVGSLKAGGYGIDLIGGSVVIHYDRWWNAAREEQATDRVYRIGQKRGVQVFKLISEKTIEEKIDAIIERKRELVSAVIPEDSPEAKKIFTREELIEILEP